MPQIVNLSFILYLQLPNKNKLKIPIIKIAKKFQTNLKIAIELRRLNSIIISNLRIIFNTDQYLLFVSIL